MINPFIRTNKVDPADILQFNFDDFSGGLNNRSTPMQLAMNEAVNISNMSFVTDGGIEKRWGTEVYDTLDLNEPIVYMAIYHPINKPEVLIRATESEVYADEVKIADVYSAIQGTNYIGDFYFVDGKGFYVYDGTNVYEIKEPPHAYLSENANSGTSSLTLIEWDERIEAGGAVQIEGINAIETATISTIDSVSGIVTLTSPLTGDYYIDELVRFYIPRDESYYEGVHQVDETLKVKWYEPCAHELDDIYKGECYMPKNCSYIAYDSERLFVAGDPDHPHEIYIGDINNPYYFPVTIGMQCPPNGDRIKSLLQFDNAIVVGRSNDIYGIYGETADYTMANMFTMKKLDTHTGMASANNACLGQDFMFYVGSDMNVYAMRTPRGDNESLSTVFLNKDKVILSKHPLNITYAELENCPAIFFEDEYLFIVRDMVVVYNYIYRAWTIYNGLNASCFLKKDNELLIGTIDGIVSKKSETWNDRGEAIVCTYRSGQYTFKSPINYKDFLDLYIVAHAYEGCDSSVRIASLVDYHEVLSYKDVDTMLSKFGVTTFGSMLISNNISQSDNIPIDLRGRTYTFIIGNDVLNEPTKVYQISGTYKVRGVR